MLVDQDMQVGVVAGVAPERMVFGEKTLDLAMKGEHLLYAGAAEVEEVHLEPLDVLQVEEAVDCRFLRYWATRDVIGSSLVGKVPLWMPGSSRTAERSRAGPRSDSHRRGRRFARGL